MGHERLQLGDPSFFWVVAGDDMCLRSLAEGAVFDEGTHMMKEAGCHHGVSDAKGEISEKQSHLRVQPCESVGEKRAFHHITGRKISTMSNSAGILILGSGSSLFSTHQILVKCLFCPGQHVDPSPV